ncbi:DNA-binding protein [Klebsiella pneumoniae]|uniref:DNA-binding protein n=1 Tax=Klebsiella pneumoniae TaxID=573 RepID=UPI0024A8658E|nr:DNA-binding protein [Klebsiella pneumoniae]HDO7098932.1 hypothetical protein [Klebsiella pneumoniae]
MINHWMNPKEICTLEGMPGTVQGVHKKAKREGWPSRKREGVQGPGIEYLVPCDPLGKGLAEPTENATTNPVDGIDEIWMALISRLTEDEKNSLLNHAIINGIASLVPNNISKRAQSIAQLIESLSADDQREILHLIEAKKLGALLDTNQERKRS